MSDLRGLTVRQPWAWAIAEGADWPDVAKMTENRSAGFATKYRGPVLIHASKSWSRRGAADERVKSLWVQGATWGMVGDLHEEGFVLGAGIAVAELVDVHPDQGCCRPWGESEYVGHDQKLHRGVTHLLWEDVRRLAEPIPCRGALGLWKVPPDVAARLSSPDVSRSAVTDPSGHVGPARWL